MRHKQNSFKDENEVRDWVFCTKLLYMLTSPSMKKGDARVMPTTHIAKVIDIMEDAKYYYCGMEHVRGRDLFEHARPRRREIN